MHEAGMNTMRSSTLLVLRFAFCCPMLPLAFGTSAASAQPACGTTGPDVIIGDMPTPTNYDASGALDAFSLGASMCNIGNLPAVFQASTNQHPIVTQNLFRLMTVDGAPRFEQIGMSWCYHAFFALSNNLCCPTCIPTDGTTLGVGCTDPVTPQIMGGQHGSGPRRQVNAATGAFPYPPANPSWSGTVARRLQALLTDLDPTLNPGAQYFVQHVIISPDDAAAGNAANNSSFRRVAITPSTPQAGYRMSTAGATQRARTATEAWRDADPTVTVVPVAVPDDGLCFVAARVTRIASATWRYEYAVENLTSDRSAGSFHVPLPSHPRLVVRETGFHDVDYHSGDGLNNVTFDGADWIPTITATTISWSTSDWATNPNANALRWGTLYNFRFDCNAAPGPGEPDIGLFKPGKPGSVLAPGLPVPAAQCEIDWNADGAITTGDFFDFLTDFFVGMADFNTDGRTTSQDFFDFIAAFFTGC